MAQFSTYSQARANLAKLCDSVVEEREIVVINRRNKEDVALIAMSELGGIMETAHLLRSPKNAERLLKALHNAKNRKHKPSSLDEVRQALTRGEKVRK